MLGTAVILSVVFIVLLTMAYMKSLPHKGLPPGPRTRPFIGNLGLVYRNMYFHNALEELGKKYKGIFSLQMVSKPVVVISDPHIMKEALVDKAEWFSDRPLHLLLIQMLFRGNGLVFQNGEKWEKIRRIVVSSMRNFGVGKATLEERVLDEIHYVTEEINKTDEQPFHLKHTFHKAVCNVVCSFLFGKRFDHSDKEFVHFLDDLTNLFSNGDFSNYAVYLNPIAICIATLVQPSMLLTLSSNLKCREFAKRRVKEHRDRFDPDNIRDFVDMYLDAEVKANADAAYTDGMIFQSIMDIFFAGTESTSTTLMWIFLFLIKYPYVQDKCRDEVLKVVGNSRLVYLKDKPQMPYLEATIHETLRIASASPYGGLHNTAKTTTLAGYTIPKDTVVITDYYAVHMDPKVWPDPREFRPERFLDESGRLRKKVDNFLAFGLGKRKCMGDNMAKIELFLVISNLLQRFKFKATDIERLPGVEDSQFGVNLIPPYYELIAEKIL